LGRKSDVIFAEGGILRSVGTRFDKVGKVAIHMYVSKASSAYGGEGYVDLADVCVTIRQYNSSAAKGTFTLGPARRDSPAAGKRCVYTIGIIDGIAPD
jgi:hypothetical protein